MELRLKNTKQCLDTNVELLDTMILFNKTVFVLRSSVRLTDCPKTRIGNIATVTDKMRFIISSSPSSVSCGAGFFPPNRAISPKRNAALVNVTNTASDISVWV